MLNWSKEITGLHGFNMVRNWARGLSRGGHSGDRVWCVCVCVERKRGRDSSQALAKVPPGLHLPALRSAVSLAQAWVAVVGRGRVDFGSVWAAVLILELFGTALSQQPLK